MAYDPKFFPEDTIKNQLDRAIEAINQIDNPSEKQHLLEQHAQALKAKLNSKKDTANKLNTPVKITICKQILHFFDTVEGGSKQNNFIPLLRSDPTQILQRDISGETIKKYLQNETARPVSNIQPQAEIKPNTK